MYNFAGIISLIGKPIKMIEPLRKRSGLTLIELTVVIGIITLLAGLGIPAVRAFIDSFASVDSVASQIHAALASARSMAMEEQRYVGIRFQKVCPEGFGETLDLPGFLDHSGFTNDTFLNSDQCMVFIQYAGNSDYANRFEPVTGIQPVRLPGDFQVITLPEDEQEIANNRSTGDAANQGGLATLSNVHEEIANDRSASDAAYLWDLATFSMIFSPDGKLAMGKEVQIRALGSGGHLFCKFTKDIDHSSGRLFLEDAQDQKSDQLKHYEIGRARLAIIEMDDLRKRLNQGQTGPWSTVKQKRFRINPYSGQLVRSQ